MHIQLTEIEIMDQKEFFEIFMVLIQLIKNAHTQKKAYLTLSPDELYYDRDQKELISVIDFSSMQDIGQNISQRYQTDDSEGLVEIRKSHPFVASEAFYCKEKKAITYSENSRIPSFGAKIDTTPPIVQASMDIYSLGAIVYRLLSKNLNFSDKEKEKALAKSSTLNDILFKCALSSKKRHLLTRIENEVIKLQKQVELGEELATEQIEDENNQVLRDFQLALAELYDNRNSRIEADVLQDFQSALAELYDNKIETKIEKIEKAVTGFDTIFSEFQNADTENAKEAAARKFNTASKSLFFHNGDEESNETSDHDKAQLGPQKKPS